MSSNNNSNNNNNSNTDTRKSPWSKFGARFSKPNATTFPELPDCLTWVRFVIAIGYGIILGFQGAHGGMGIFLGLSAITFLPTMYVDSILRADTNSYSNLTFVGVPNALALMTLIWIIFFTMQHEVQEAQFTSLLMDIVVTQMDDNDSSSSSLTNSMEDGNGVGAGAGNAGMASDMPPVMEEQEF